MKKGVLLLMIAIPMIAIQSWVGYLTFKYPYLGINLTQNTINEWSIKSLDNGSGSRQLNIHPGDVVQLIDGQYPYEHSTLKWLAVEQADTLDLLRNGEHIHISTEKIFRPSIEEVFLFFCEIVSFLIATLLFTKVYQSNSARSLSLVFLIYGIIFMSILGSIRADQISSYIVQNVLMLLPVVFWQFLIVFFREKCDIQLTRKYVKYLYLLVLLISLMNLRDIFSVPLPYAHYFRISAVLGAFCIGFIVNLYLLTYVFVKYRKERSYASTIIKTVWASLFISFAPVIVFTFIPQILGISEWLDGSYTTWFVLFFPLSFAYLLITKKLYDIDMVLRRVAYTVILSIIPSALITGIIAIVFQKEASLEHLTFIFMMILVILSFVLYSFEYVSSKLESVIFPRKHFLQKSLKSIARKLGTISNFRELKDIILVDIVNTMQVHGGAIVFKYRDIVEVIHEGEIDPEDIRRIVELDEPDYADYTGFEINRHEEYTSYLILTRKKTHTFLGIEEIQWLNLIITYLSVSLENIFLIRKLTIRLQQFASQIPNEAEASELSWFRKLMFELQESERVRIATDLHDTTMQDLFFLKRRLVSLLGKYVVSKEDKVQLDSLVEYIEIINMNLRQNCFVLHPYLLTEIGLVETVRKLIDQEAAVCEFEVSYNVGRLITLEQQGLETKTHIFRMIQELLNNAKKHSRASKVRISLSEIGHSLHLDYEDDGVGFDPDRPIHRTVGSSGMGIEQIKSRILYLGGHWELDSGIGRGTRFSVHIPLNKEMTA